MRYEFRNEEVFIITTQERCKTYTDRRKTYTDTIYREGVRMTTETKFMETETNKEKTMTTETNNNDTRLSTLIEGETFRVNKDLPCECCGNTDFDFWFFRLFWGAL